MTFTERKRKQEYLLELIKKGRCFSLEQTANLFECSKRTVKRMIAELREEDNNIKYSRINIKFFIADQQRDRFCPHSVLSL